MKLKRNVEMILWIITIILFIFGSMIDDLSLNMLPGYLFIWVVIGFNAFILKKYGKGVIYESKK